MKRIVTIAILMLFIATNGITGKNTVDPNYAKIFNANAWGIEPSSEPPAGFRGGSPNADEASPLECEGAQLHRSARTL